MKKLLIVTACLAASMVAYGQGTVTFGNSNPVNNVDGKTGLNSQFDAELYAGPVGGSLTAIAASITPFLDVAPGFFFDATDVAIPGIATGGSADAVVKAWKISNGTSYEAALAAGGATGVSAKFTITGLGGGGPPPLPGATMNMPGFSLTVVPEPSTIALGLLGAGALFLRRRK